MNHLASWVAGDNVLGLPKYLPLDAVWWLAALLWSEVLTSALAHTLERHGVVTYMPDANGNGHLAWGFLDVLGEGTCEGLGHSGSHFISRKSFPGGE